MIQSWNSTTRSSPLERIFMMETREKTVAVEKMYMNINPITFFRNVNFTISSWPGI
jgi:hypothetical protein